MAWWCWCGRRHCVVCSCVVVGLGRTPCGPVLWLLWRVSVCAMWCGVVWCGVVWCVWCVWCVLCVVCIVCAMFVVCVWVVCGVCVCCVRCQLCCVYVCVCVC